ncbi:MAG: hypothetical protein JO197_23355 [Acidobacteria bacterium]|nr:hypothetical protein [Acidobacteriota bacterium]MBV9477854.1 hypothetical protein [Acidobacteriota bacterium]
MAFHQDLTGSAKYLLESIHPQIFAQSPHEILATAASRIRDRVREWWARLEPEATAGVSVDMAEEGLVRIAGGAIADSHHSVGRTWAKQLDWKARMLDISAEEVIAERFLTAAERLGVLVSQGKNVKFTHDCLLEIYFAIGIAKSKVLPMELRRESRTSVLPLRTSTGRSALALPALVRPDDADEWFIAIANENLNMGAWFLYFNESARKTHGEWLCAELLSTFDWDLDGATYETLHAALVSLGEVSLPAARRFIDARAGSLPAYPSAVSVIARYGDESDIPRLRGLSHEHSLGSWEIERMRHLIRDAEIHVFDEAARARYEREKGAEVARQTVSFVLKTAGMILAKTAAPHTHWNHEMKQWSAGQAVKGAGSLMTVLANTEFLQQQAALRELLARLPAQIEKRKTQVAATAPQVVAGCGAAIERLMSRGTHST